MNSKRVRIIDVKTLLGTALEHLQQIVQWDKKVPHNMAKYADKAEALIEVVEVYDCGSIGGFGKGQRNDKGILVYSDIYEEIYARWLWLAEKYNYGKGMYNYSSLQEWIPIIEKYFRREVTYQWKKED